MWGWELEALKGAPSRLCQWWVDNCNLWRCERAVEKAARLEGRIGLTAGAEPRRNRASG